MILIKVQTGGDPKMKFLLMGLAPGGTLEVGQGQSQGKFFLVRRSDGRTGAKSGKFFLVGRWDGGTVGRQTDGSFYFALEPP